MNRPTEIKLSAEDYERIRSAYEWYNGIPDHISEIAGEQFHSAMFEWTMNFVPDDLFSSNELFVSHFDVIEYVPTVVFGVASDSTTEQFNVPFVVDPNAKSAG